METICPRCKYKWSYKGKMTIYVTCPNCKRSVKIKQKGDKNDKTKVK